MPYKHTYGILFLIWTLLNVVQSSHFRGSMISWRVINSSSSSVTLQILQRHAWRYTYFTPLCTDATIPNNQPILGQIGHNIICVSNCPTGLTTLGSVTVPCTGYNIGEQYAMGEGRFNIQVPQNKSFIAAFNAAAWFLLVTGNSLPWSVAVQIQTFKRIDTGRYNNAPVVTMLPIYRLRNRISYSIKINVADNDFDPYICLWSEGPLQCGGLTDSVPGGTVDNYGCYLYFTPNITGYYAAALTVEDFVVLPTNITSTNYLSQVPIQFIFHVYDSVYPCFTGPIYVGDLVPDICIYISVGSTSTTRVRFRVQCPNATVDSIISVNPTGLLTTPLLRDSFDPDIYAFIANFTASIDQIGQNLFCFAAVDSFGNQGDSACLRFTVSSPTSSLQPLYLWNAVRFPMGTLVKTTSVWTIFTGGKVYTRPTTETYIRFKRTSDDGDYYILNVATSIDRVLFYSDRIVINSSVVWTPGQSFYIYFDPGVFAEASTCTKDAMPISDPNFWSFNIPDEATTTETTVTTTTSVSSTVKPRTTPTQRKLNTSIATTLTSTTTTTPETTPTKTTSTIRIRTTYRLPISAIVGITLASLFVCILLSWIIHSILHVILISYLLLQSGLQRQLLTIRSTSTLDIRAHRTKSQNFNFMRQYMLATRHRLQQTKEKYAVLPKQNIFRKNLVETSV